MNCDDIINKYNNQKKKKCKKHNKKIHNKYNNKCSIFNNFDVIAENHNVTTDFLQKQLNTLNCKIGSIDGIQNCNNERYLQLLREVDYLILNTEKNADTINDCECDKNSDNRVVYTDTSTIHRLIIKKDIKFVFITMTGGGGAGGIGFVNGIYYCSAGGGGAGSCCIKIPLCVQKNDVLCIKVGKGGDIKTNTHGSDSYVELIRNCERDVIIADGGINGKPYFNSLCELKSSDITNNDIDELSGGNGGINLLNKCFSGENGENGIITVPSQLQACGGNGGNNNFYSGGTGGKNYFHSGGDGGNEHLNTSPVGLSGKFGSGGGGSASIMNHSNLCVLSGNGGDGFVIIEY